MPALKGLRLVDQAGRIVRNGVDAPGLSLQGTLPLLERDGIRAQLSAFLGRPLYTDDLPRIAKTISDWYRAHDLPVVNVAFPEQDLAGGTLQAVVTVYRLGQVEVSGNKWFSSKLLTGEMRLRTGQPMDFGLLSEDLNRLNRNPFRDVDAVLQRSGSPGHTDLALRVRDRLPLRLYAGYDNDGLPVTGRDRYSVGLNWGNAFGLDQQFSYQFITSPDLWHSRNRGPGLSDKPRFNAHSFNYSAPLPWGDDVQLFGSYVELVPDLGPDLGQVGRSTQLSLRYDRYLPPWHALSQQISAGFDFKRSNNNLAFGGTQVFDSTTNVEQFLLLYNATLHDAYGQTAIDNQLVFSPGGLSRDNRSSVFVNSGTPGANATYVYDNLQLTRVTYLPYRLTAVIRLQAQLASTELLPSEQLGAGGEDSVRGYDPRSASGTQGVLASFELRSPAYHPLRALGNTSLPDRLQGLLFIDTGYVAYRHAQQGQPCSTRLGSVGLGLRYALDRYLDLRFDYGWQLSAAPGAGGRDSLAHLSLTLSY